MTQRRLPARTAARIVIAVLLLAALMPALLRIATADQPQLWAEICSASSGKSAPPSSDPTAPGVADNTHCPWCQLHAAAPGLPPAAPAALALPTDLRHLLPARFLSAARTAHAWRHGPARAPPPTV